jgi:uncharacterized protein
MSTLITRDTGPWYREPWPWLLMLGPGLAIIAASYSAWLAVSGADGLVADDYYTQGLAINHQLARDATARRLGLHATARLDRDTVIVDLASQDSAGALPPVLNLLLVHKTRAGLDQSVALERKSGGVYAGKITAPAPGLWNVALEHREWRLTAQWQAPFDRNIELSPGG